MEPSSRCCENLSTKARKIGTNICHNYLLFAYREVPQESTGFSPFELLYGRRVRGPLDILKESWTEEAQEETPIAQYVIKMRNNLKEMVDM